MAGEDISSEINEMILIMDGTEPEGVCGLSHINWKDRSAETSYYSGLREPLRNARLVTGVYKFLKRKAFTEYGLNRLWGEVYSFNAGSLKIALINGFKQEGRLRQTYFCEGKFWDSIIISILREEYYEKLSVKGVSEQGD